MRNNFIPASARFLTAVFVLSLVVASHNHAAAQDEQKDLQIAAKKLTEVESRVAALFEGVNRSGGMLQTTNEQRRDMMDLFKKFQMAYRETGKEPRSIESVEEMIEQATEFETEVHETILLPHQREALECLELRNQFAATGQIWSKFISKHCKVEFRFSKIQNEQLESMTKKTEAKIADVFSNYDRKHAELVAEKRKALEAVLNKGQLEIIRRKQAGDRGDF